MDDSTRTPQTEPEGRATGQSTGTGWSTPGHDAPQATAAPWSQANHDTGSVPRPHDTRQLPATGPDEASQVAVGPTPPAAAGTPASGSGPSSATPGAGSYGPFGPSGTASYGGDPPYEINHSADVANQPPKSKRGTALIAALALGAGLVGGAAGAGIVSALDDEPASPLSSLDNEATDAADLPEGSGVEEVAGMVTPSVVSIGIQSTRGPGSGSGVVISSDGQIMTNAHVAAAAGENGAITVTFHDGSTADAEVVGMDEQTDIAVLQAEDVSGLQPAELGDSDALAVGSAVIAFGSPLGLDGTVTQGIVSALHRPVLAGDESQAEQPTVFEAIQTDASINPGNSGGPLVNTGGQVVGINTAIATSPGTQGSIGLGFAIPINTARYIAAQIVDDGEVEYARIGIGVDNGDGPDPAATVAQVQEGGAADEAGLEEGDVITHIDDRFMSDASAVVAAARSFQPGDEVTLSYVRDGKEHTVDITLGSSADDDDE